MGVHVVGHRVEDFSWHHYNPCIGKRTTKKESIIKRGDQDDWVSIMKVCEEKAYLWSTLCKEVFRKASSDEVSRPGPVCLMIPIALSTAQKQNKTISINYLRLIARQRQLLTMQSLQKVLYFRFGHEGQLQGIRHHFAQRRHHLLQ